MEKQEKTKGITLPDETWEQIAEAANATRRTQRVTIEMALAIGLPLLLAKEAGAEAAAG